MEFRGEFVDFERVFIESQRWTLRLLGFRDASREIGYPDLSGRRIIPDD